MGKAGDESHRRRPKKFNLLRRRAKNESIRINTRERSQKSKKHKIDVCGKEHTANLRVYKFEQLDKETKLEILTIIKENFKKEYYEIIFNKTSYIL